MNWFGLPRHDTLKELHINNCRDFTKSRHSPGNTSFPIFHHERPIANLLFLTYPMNQCTPGSVFLNQKVKLKHSRLSHTKGEGLVWFEREWESPIRPAILRTNMSYQHSTFTQTHQTQASHGESLIKQVSYFYGKCFKWWKFHGLLFKT
jgi:hypothetical protein